MASQLSIYNESLRLCGERRLSSVSEERKSRRLLDDVWDNNGRQRCLELGQWRFAIRTSEIPYSSDLTPPFGYRRPFAKPDDIVRVVGIFSDEYCRHPYTAYFDESEYWFADIDTLYVRYVSNDAQYGLNMGKWPETFSMFVGAHFASEIVTDLTKDEKKWAVVYKTRNDRLKDALSNDAMNDPVRFLPQGGWVSARGGGRGESSGGQLIG